MARPIGHPGLAELCARSDGSSVKGLANFCGVNRSSINRYLAGRHSPELQKKLAEFFGLSVRSLRRKLGLIRRSR
jgi:predicted transcriptional regulator